MIGVKRLKRVYEGIPLSLVRMRVPEKSLYVKAEFLEWTKSQHIPNWFICIFSLYTERTAVRQTVCGTDGGTLLFCETSQGSSGTKSVQFRCTSAVRVVLELVL